MEEAGEGLGAGSRAEDTRVKTMNISEVKSGINGNKNVVRCYYEVCDQPMSYASSEVPLLRLVCKRCLSRTFKKYEPIEKTEGTGCPWEIWNVRQGTGCRYCRRRSYCKLIGKMDYKEKTDKGMKKCHQTAPVIYVACPNCGRGSWFCQDPEIDRCTDKIACRACHTSHPIADWELMYDLKGNKKRKGRQMKWLAKVLRRVIVLWCVYGLVRICVWANPFVMKLAKLVFAEDFVYNPGASTAGIWFLLILALGGIVLAIYALHCFAAWLFNEKK